MEQLRSDIVANIRSCLVSVKGAITIRQLEKDYGDIVGAKIPFQKLGYNRLEDFLHATPTLVVIRRNGELYIDAKPNAKVAHISDLVANQRNIVNKYRKSSRLHFTAGRSQSHGYNDKTSVRSSHSASYESVWRPKKNFVPSRINRINTSVAQIDINSRHSPTEAKFIPATKVVNYGPAPSNSILPPITTESEYRHTPSELSYRSNYRPTPSPLLTTKIAQPQRLAAKTNLLPTRTNTINRLLVSSETDVPAPMMEANLESVTKPLTLMNKMNLEQDSSHSSSTIEKQHKPLSDYNHYDPTKDGRNYYAELQQLAQQWQLGEVTVKYREVTGNKPKKTVVICLIQVGSDITERSYPTEFFDRPSALRYASYRVLQTISKRMKQASNLPQSSPQMVLERIPLLLQEQTESGQGIGNAVWHYHIESLYVKKFAEQLPKDWLSIIKEGCSRVWIEQQGDKRYLLTYYQPLQKSEALPTSSVIALSEVLETEKCTSAKYKKVPAVVLAVGSVSDVWCQWYEPDTLKQWTELTQQMEMFYTQSIGANRLKPANTVTLGGQYAVQFEDSWARVKVTAIGDSVLKDHVECFLIDYGIEIDTTREKLYQLEPHFNSLSAQAFACRLNGIEAIEELSANYTDWMDLLQVGERIQLEVNSIDAENDVTIVTLYEEDSDLSINDSIIDAIAKEISAYKLSKEKIEEVQVSHVDSTGDLFIQLQTPAWLWLRAQLTEWTLPSNATSIKETTSSTDNIHILRDKAAGSWKRVRIKDCLSLGSVMCAQCELIDFGQAMTVELGGQQCALYEINISSSQDGGRGHMCSVLPPQAYKARLPLDQDDLEVLQQHTKFVELARRLLMPTDQKCLLMKVCAESDGSGDPGVLVVDFFKRSPEEGALYCVSKALGIEADITRNASRKSKETSTATGGTTSSKVRTKKHAHWNIALKKDTVPSGGLLTRPKVPGIGEFFNVRVPIATHPWNFFVQPLDTASDLDDLMERIQSKFAGVQFNDKSMEPKIPLNSVQPGHIYIARHTDKQWYRVSILKVICKDSISVFFCDYGHYTGLSLEDLHPADDSFLKLPYQALKAGLVGVKPIDGTMWRVEDCALFRRMVVDQMFVSVIRSVENDELYKWDVVLKLSLIDTTGTNDVKVSERLVDMGIAAVSVE